MFACLWNSTQALLYQKFQYLKGGSSHRLFRLHPELKKRYWDRSLWSSGKFFRSVENVTADTIKHYIKESQRKLKADSIVRIKGIWATKIRRFQDSINPSVRACGPKHTPSVRVGWTHAVLFCWRAASPASRSRSPEESALDLPHRFVHQSFVDLIRDAIFFRALCSDPPKLSRTIMLQIYGCG
jgi:hypothetical protein